jgi:pyridoxine/pyridoxamine 5'-phosphate oxidase
MRQTKKQHEVELIFPALKGKVVRIWKTKQRKTDEPFFVGVPVSWTGLLLTFRDVTFWNDQKKDSHDFNVCWLKWFEVVD